MPSPRLIFGLLLVHLLASAAADASDGWRLFRRIHVPAGAQEGPVAVALDAAVVEKCRPDLADVRVVSGSGLTVPVMVEGVPQNGVFDAIPAKILRITRRPGSYTEISIDKSGKILSRGVTIQTPSKDFVRKVELRGSDNGRELYVVRMDGLIVSRSKPVPLRSLTIDHPVNNFQYLHVRILDEDQPPLKIEGVVCEPPEEEDGFTAPLSVRIIENRTDLSRNATVIVADLGERRFPLRSVSIATRTKSFVKKFILSGSSSPASESWGKIAEGTLYRITHEESVKEQLTATFAPQPIRFVMLEMTGPDGPPVEVDELRAAGRVSYAVFHYKPGEEFRLFYHNPSSEPRQANPSFPRLTLQLASASSEIKLGPEEKNVASATERKWEPQVEEERSLQYRAHIAAALFALALLLLIGMVLRWRRGKRHHKYRSPRIYNVK